MKEDAVLLAEVTNLIHNEAKYLDRRDWEKWLELYTEDAVFWAPSWSDEETIVEEPQTQLNLVFLEGRGKLEDRVFRIETGDSYASMPLDRTVHVVGNITIDNVQGEEVEASGNAIVHSYGRHGCKTNGNMYEYILKRKVDKLKIVRKKVIMIDDAVAGPIDIYHF